MAYLAKKNIAWIIIGLFTVYYFIYLQVVTVNIAWQTWFFHLPLVEKYFDGTLVFKDLLTRYGEHGLLGYNILFIINGSLFHLTTFFDVYINLVLILVCTILIFVIYKKSLIISTNTTAAPYLYFATIAFTMFTITQQSTGGMDTQVRIGISFFLITTVMIDRFFYNKSNQTLKLISILIMIYLSVIVFGTFYSLAAVPGILVLCIIHFYKQKRVDFSFILIASALITSWIIYIKIYSLFQSNANDGSSFFNEIVDVFLNPVKSAEFILAFMNSSIFGRTLWEDHYLSASLMLFGGLIVSFIYIFSTYVFFKTKMWEKTYLPILMMAYSFGVMVLVLVGRNQMSWDGGTNYWYAVHTKFGIIGCLWIMYYKYFSSIKFNLSQSKVIKYTNVILITIIILGQVISNMADWKRAPHVRQYFNAMIPYALTVSDMPVDNNNMTPLINTPETTTEGLSIMRKYNLNVFYDYKTSIINQNGFVLNKGKFGKGIMGIGFYDDEGGRRWIKKEAGVTFQSGNEGKITIDGFMPDFLAPNEINIYSNKKLVHNNQVESGNFKINFDVEKNSLVNMEIILSKSVIPKDAGMNEDTREIAATINSITSK